ncbi:hypothetical protein SynROS8604_01287 [Synechococcus sp. ROS8604]|nr:hypothetical protein SynROS8604_01287 [Synechococcus sp. ROS8604]
MPQSDSIRTRQYVQPRNQIHPSELECQGSELNTAMAIMASASKGTTPGRIYHPVLVFDLRRQASAVI